MAASDSPSERITPISPNSPVAVFDSGVGGLTVLHELLVSLPAEDYLYLGDTAHFPYGDRSDAELQEFSLQIAEHLLAQGAKLLVVACNSASAAAFETLERWLGGVAPEVDVIGVLSPAAQLAVVATHNGRIGLLATPATVANGGYERAIGAADPHVHLESVACPDLAPIIQSGFPFDEGVVDTVRKYCAPLRAAAVDTVILGSTHYPLCAPILQRMLGRGVTLVSAGAGVARSVERALAARDLLNQRAGRAETATAGNGWEGTAVAGGEWEGTYRFQCTGEPESFRELGTRFLQMPLGRVERITLPRSIVGSQR